MYLIFFILFLIIFCLWIIPIPGKIAANRGISGSELQTIKVLSWCGLFWGITWFIALGLALIWKPGKWISDKESEEPSSTTSDFETLEKLHNLYVSKALTKQEYEKMKKEILQRN